MLYLFDKTEKLLGQLKTNDIVEAYQNEVTNGTIDLEFTILQTALPKMEDVVFVAHKDSINLNDFQMYKIINSYPSNAGISYEAIHIVFDDLKNYGFIKDSRPYGVEAGVALSQALSGTRWQVGTVEPTKIGSTNFYYESPLEAISKILDNWDVEISYRLTISGNKISKRYVDLKNKIGRVTNKRFVYGSNAIEVVREVTDADLYTAAVGRGKGLEITDEDGEATGGYSRKIGFQDVEWKVANGDPVNKPLGQEFVEIPERTALYGYSDGTARFKVLDYGDIEDPEELLLKTYQDLEINSRPKVQFKTKAINADDLGLGDTVGIIRKDLNIYYTTRVFKIKRDLLTNSLVNLEFGDNIDYSQSKKNKELKNELKNLNSTLSQVVVETNDNLNNFVDEVREEIVQSYFNEDGYNYELKIGNKHNLPAGYYSFNKPIDQNPTKVIYQGAGKLMISNSKDVDGNWIWTTAATGDGFTADVVNAGTLNANLIKAGIIAPLNGNSFINMTTGAFNFNNDIIYNPSNNKTTITNGIITSASIANATINSAQIGTLDARYFTLNGVTLENFINSKISTNGFELNNNGNFNLNGNSVAFGGNSNYLTIKDTGGRGQVDAWGTVAAKGSNYTIEMQSGGLYMSGSKITGESGYIRLSPTNSSSGVIINTSTMAVFGKTLVFNANGTVTWS